MPSGALIGMSVFGILMILMFIAGLIAANVALRPNRRKYMLFWFGLAIVCLIGFIVSSTFSDYTEPSTTP
jgi:lipopolysaccharide export LptBFGC system permease protein LptF